MTDKTETKETTTEEASKTEGDGIDTSVVEVAPETTFVKASGEAGSDQVQEKMDEAQDKGYFGEAPDPRPNEYYTVAEAGKRNEEAK